MLVLTRKSQEQIRISDNIVLTVLRVSGNAVRIGIEAPRDVRILRGELPPHPPAGVAAENAAGILPSTTTPEPRIAPPSGPAASDEDPEAGAGQRAAGQRAAGQRAHRTLRDYVQAGSNHSVSV